MSVQYWLVKTYNGEYHGEFVIKAESVSVFGEPSGIIVNGAIILMDMIVSVKKVTEKTALNFSNWYGKDVLQGKVKL